MRLEFLIRPGAQKVFRYARMLRCNTMWLSLLIPTLEQRRAQFDNLTRELNRQIREGGWSSQVEILGLADAGENSIGWKRNELMRHAGGLFVAFIDDDDLVSGDYVSRICRIIERNPEIDCIGIRGSITFRGGKRCEFIHSTRYTDYFSRSHAYYRPPYHLNPIRREIALRYPFANVSYSEDIDYALRLRDDGALRNEVFIDALLYHYRCRRPWAYQWLLDVTEPVRHKFGIRWSNRLRFAKPAHPAAAAPPSESGIRSQCRLITG